MGTSSHAYDPAGILIDDKNQIQCKSTKTIIKNQQSVLNHPLLNNKVKYNFKLVFNFVVSEQMVLDKTVVLKQDRAGHMLNLHFQSKLL